MPFVASPTHLESRPREALPGYHHIGTPTTAASSELGQHHVTRGANTPHHLDGVN